MDAARDAISRHTSRKGHFTEVDEVVRPAVTLETVKPHRHEVMTEAIDKEVHQHHHHTTVVPLTHSQTLPTKHSHNLLPVKKVHHQHENPAETQRALAELAAHFRDTLTTLPTTHSSTQAPRIVGEHYHHHVHEIVQPVIYKETIQQEHVHTTVPVHEVHHVVAKHHGLSALPMKPMQEFLAFNKDRSPDHVTQSTFEGPPRPYDSKLSTTFEKLGFHHNHNGNHGLNHNDSRGLNNTTGLHGLTSGTGTHGLNHNDSRGSNTLSGSHGLNNNGTHGLNTAAGTHGPNHMGNQGLDHDGTRGLNNTGTHGLSHAGTHGLNSTTGTHGLNNSGMRGLNNTSGTHGLDHNGIRGMNDRSTHGLGHNATNNLVGSIVPAPINTTGNTDPNGRLLQRKPTPPKTPVLQHHNNRSHRRSYGRDGMSPVSRGSLSSMSSASSVSSSAPSTPNSPSHRHTLGPKTTTTVVSPTHTTVSGPLNSHTTMQGPRGTTIDTTTSTHHSLLGNNHNNNTMTPMSNSNNNTMSRLSNNNTTTPLSNNNNTTPFSNNNTMTPSFNNNSNTMTPMTNNSAMTPSSNFNNNDYNNNTNNKTMNPMTISNNNNTLPSMTGNKRVSTNESVQIVGADESPRTSDEDYPSRQRGSFISRLSGSRTSTGATRRF